MFSRPGRNRREIDPDPLAHAANWRHSTPMTTSKRYSVKVGDSVAAEYDSENDAIVAAITIASETEPSVEVWVCDDAGSLWSSFEAG